MKLLLDEMHAPPVAEVLREQGFDVEAVAGVSSELKSLSDGDLLAFAAAMERALVTENVADFLTNLPPKPRAGSGFRGQVRSEGAGWEWWLT